ncbi:hypothetical protein B0H14DRAFT_3155004 [Mycena olivaceomarginata]|nr:hypothetical protein B0H14DRAFT_3155004 [Mycena olivaceomarginata]
MSAVHGRHRRKVDRAVGIHQSMIWVCRDRSGRGDFTARVKKVGAAGGFHRESRGGAAGEFHRGSKGNGGWISRQDQKILRQEQKVGAADGFHRESKKLSTAGGFHSESKKRARRADFTAKAEAARRVNFTAGAKGAAGGFHGKTEKWARQLNSTAREWRRGRESKKRARRADFTAKAEAVRRVNFTAGAKGTAGGFHGKTKKWVNSTARANGAAGRFYGKSKKITRGGWISQQKQKASLAGGFHRESRGGAAGGFHRGDRDVSWYLAGEYHRGTLVSVGRWCWRPLVTALRDLPANSVIIPPAGMICSASTQVDLTPEPSRWAI